jgi:uncharacterized membrane protein
LDRETGVLALLVVTMLAVLAAVYPILPANGENFSELGVLGPGQKIADYPTAVVAGQQFTLYVYVGNHEGGAAYYQVLIKEGNQATVVSNSTFANLPPVLTSPLVLKDNSSTIFPVSLRMSTAGLNQRLIFELWMLNSTTAGFAYTGLWNALWLNVTAPSG